MELYIQFPLAKYLKINQSYNIPITKVMKFLTDFLLISFISISINKKPNYSVEHGNYNKISRKTYISSK